jgi:AraC-like DNA-binding protein
MPFLEFCQQHGLPAEASLRRYQLPTDIRDAAHIYLPQEAGLFAIKDVCERSGVLDMPARVATSTEFSDYGENICNTVHYSPTILVAIRRLAAQVRLEDSSLSIRLKPGRDTTWIITQKSTGAEFDCNDWSNIMLLVHTMRTFLGKDWQPPDAQITSAPREFALAKPYFPDSRLFWHPHASGISIPTELLSASRADALTCDIDNKTSPEESPCELGLLETVQGLIAAYLPAGGPSIGLLAEMAGTSSRSLQRELRNSGLTYSELLDQTRFEKAAHLLRSTDAKAMDIALEVGYDDPSHFSRAFKRIAGVSPRDYRRQQSLH